MISSATLAAVRNLRDAERGGYLWQAGRGQTMDASDGTLMGKPLGTCEDMRKITDGSPQVTVIMVGDCARLRIDRDRHALDHS